LQAVTHTGVNESGKKYCYLAMAANGNADFSPVTFTGTGADGKTVTLPESYTPDFVMLKTDFAIAGAMTFSSKTSGNRGFVYWGEAPRDDLFASLDASGFTVNDGSVNGANLVNRATTQTAGFAIKEVTGASASSAIPAMVRTTGTSSCRTGRLSLHFSSSNPKAPATRRSG
jgi:hypothetical protein